MKSVHRNMRQTPAFRFSKAPPRLSFLLSSPGWARITSSKEPSQKQKHFEQMTPERDLLNRCLVKCVIIDLLRACLTVCIELELRFMHVMVFYCCLVVGSCLLISLQSLTDCAFLTHLSFIPKACHGTFSNSSCISSNRTACLIHTSSNRNYHIWYAEMRRMFHKVPPQNGHTIMIGC